MEYYFIINPIAGKTDQSKVLPEKIYQAAMSREIQPESCHVLVSEYKGHAKQLAEKIAQTGQECVIFAVGGDGTFNEVLNGSYLYPNVAVGCIPYGSGNDFLRTFGERSSFLDLEAQLQGRTVAIDVMQTGHGVSAAICSVGLDAKVAYGIPKFRRFPLCGGSMAYNLSILQCLCGKLGQLVNITIDGAKLQQNCLMVAICNGKTYGGGFYAAPEASVTDGLLDVMVIKKIGLLRIAKIISVYQKGKHIKDGKILPQYQDVITFYRAKTVTIAPVDRTENMIVNEDGECTPTALLEAKILEKAARIILPKGVS